MKKAVVLLLAVTMIICSLAGCDTRKKYSASTFDSFDTVITVTMFCDTIEEFDIFKARAFELFERYHKLFDIYNTYDGISNIKSINDAAGKREVEVDKEIIDLIVFAKEFYSESNRNVNIAMGSVLSIWHEHREAGRAEPKKAKLPDMAELEEASKHTEFYKVQIDEEKSTVYLADEKMSLDVGAIAKGFATQRVADALKAEGYESFLINAGGNVSAVGTKDGGVPWTTAVEDPISREYADVFEVMDMAVATSGSNQRYYTVDKVNYHHIINPKTLMPENFYASVSVVADDAMVADALSTALFNMSVEEGTRLLEKYNAKALWILPDGEIIKSYK